MSIEKVTLLIEKLEAKTKAGDLAWEAAGARHSYELSLSQFNIRLTRSEFVAGLDYSDKNALIIEILDDRGQPIDRLDSESLATNYSMQDAEGRLEQLFANARRHAMGIEDALDSILHDLG